MDVVAGSTDVTSYFVLRKAADGTELTGATITNIDLVYTRSGSDHVAKQDATALAAPDSAHSDNKAVEVDATSAPGLYRVDWPDAAFAAGAREVILTVIYSTAFTEHLRVNLTPHGVDVLSISGDTTAADNCEAMFDGTGYAGGAIKLGVDAVALSGDTAAADNAEAMFDGTGYAGGAIKLGVDAVALSGDSAAADNAEAFFDGTGYAGTNNTIPTVTSAGLSATAIDNIWNEAVAGHVTPASYGVYLGGAPAGATLAADVADLHTDVGDVHGHVNTTDGHITADYGATEKAAVDLLDDAIGGLLDIHTDVGDVHGHVNTIDGHITADYGATEKAAIDLLDDAIAGLVDIHTDIAAIAVPSAATVADAVWNEAVADHLGVGSTGAALNGATAPTAGTVADAVWNEALADHLGAGSTGAGLNDLHTDVADVHTDVADIHTDVADLHVDVADVHTDVNAQGMAGSAAAPVVGTWGQLLDAVCRGDYQYNKVTNVETIMDRNGNVIANLTVVDGALMLTKN